MQEFWEKIDRYARLSNESRLAWEKILRPKSYKKNDFFIGEGQIPHTVAFVRKGLFSQYYITENGDVVIKRFFPES